MCLGAKMRTNEYLEEKKKIRKMVITAEDQRWADEDLVARLQAARNTAIEEWQSRWDRAAVSR